MDDVIITFLGTGSSIPEPNRFQASIALKHPHGVVIFDVGEGAQYNLRKYKVPIRKEITIAITHGHPDHYQGLGGLLASLNLLDRTKKVTILVPPNFQDMLKLLLHALKVNPRYDLEWIEMPPGTVFKGKGYTITSASALHFKNSLSYIWKEDSRPGKWDTKMLEKYNIPNKLRGKLARGQAIEIAGETITPADIIGPERKGRIIAYTGDTRPNYEFAELIKGCDVLIHDATYPSNLEAESATREHSTVAQAAKIGEYAKADVVLLTHIGTRIINMTKEKKIASRIHNSIIVYDGFSYTVSFKN